MAEKTHEEIVKAFRESAEASKVRPAPAKAEEAKAKKSEKPSDK